MNTLESVIRSKRESLGATEAGANWALQALHPSAGPFQLRGIPDEDAFPCVCMDYETVIAIPPPLNATGTWNCTLNVTPHPTQPGCFFTTATGGQVGYGGIMNPCYPPSGAVYSSITNAFAVQCSAYRMLYCGATVDLDASGLYNGGSVVAAQMPLCGLTRNYSLSSAVNPVSDVHIWDTNYDINFPGQAVSQLPGAYMGLARDGVYMPIKIDVTQPWVTTLDVQMHALSSPPTSLVTQTAGAALRALYLPVAAPSIKGIAFPFYGSAYYGNTALLETAWVNPAGNIIGDVVIKPQQVNTGLIVFYNLNVNANLTVKLRWGVEMRVAPTSPLAPAMVPSAMHDPLALAAYTDIAGQLPWAYPSSYNSLEQIMPKIFSAWNAVKPVIAAGLSLVPHPIAQAASSILTPTRTETKTVAVAASPKTRRRKKQQGKS